MENSTPILLIEDDRGDAKIFERVLKDLEVANPLVHSINCKEALEYLRDQSNEKPWIILTDLNTPEMDGLEFLKNLKADDLLSQIPVIFLTGSGNENDVAEGFKLGAAGYMVKPADYKNLVEMVTTIHKYWSLSESSVRSLDSQLEHIDSLS